MVAIVTGGTKGIGYGIAKALMELGVNVAITGRTQSTVDSALKQLTSTATGRMIGFAADVRRPDDMNRVVDGAVRKWGKLDALVANAGLGYFASIESMTVEQWTETIDTNLTGVFNSVKSSLEHLKTSRGYIITIGSLAGTNFFAGGAAYNASKFGLVGFSQAIMLDLRSHGIKVSTIMPGSVATEFNGHEPGTGDAWKIQPEDIGQIVVDLLKMHPRTLPSKVEVRPSIPPKNG